MSGEEIMNRLGNERAISAYDWLCRHRMFIAAAEVARDCGLDRHLMHEAAFKAYCRFAFLGDEATAELTAGRFGLTVMTAGLDSLLKSDGQTAGKHGLAATPCLMN